MSFSVEQTPDFRDNHLAHLRADSLTLVALAAGVIGYIWLAIIIWPVTGAAVPPPIWWGGGILTLSVIASYRLRQRQAALAGYLLLGGILITIACLVLAWQAMELTYLFVLPVIFASVLLGQGAVIWMAAAASLAVVGAGLAYARPTPFSLEVGLPIFIILLVAAASWLSVRNLYIALEWVWNGYERARQNEQMVRERQAELRRVLKALDEATRRLERVNYMLALARDQAEEARRLKQQFAQTISHELRTPLNLIVGFVELMIQTPEYYGQPLPPAYMRDLMIMHRNACHLQNLVNDVLDLARIEVAQMSLVPEETDAAVLVQEAANTARSLVESRGLSLRIDIEPDLPRLRLDPVRIRQVLFNLFNNAVRFTEKGSITVAVCRQQHELIFAVTDTGIGITPEDTGRIFEEFHQLDGSTRRQNGGIGLGLAISRRFVELHQGRMWVESQVGQGSTFFFSLPISPADLLAVPGGDSSPGQPLPTKWGEERMLLAVTRSPSAALLLNRYVRGCRTVISQSLEQARQTARQLMPQGVIIDSACEALDPAGLAGLAQEWGLTEVPFIVCSLPGEESVRQRLDVDSYLIKPLSRQDLWDALRQFGEDVDQVLVIDDDRDFVRLLARMLDSPVRRYQVTSATSAQEGLAKLERRQPDLVLLDLGLPDLDGFQVVERIRANPAWRHIPIVIISAQDEIDHMEKLAGWMVVSRAAGLKPNEIIQWVQRILDTATLPAPGLEENILPAGTGQAYT